MRWIRWTDRALFDDKGQIYSVQSFGEDITVSKQAEEKEQQHIQNIAFLSKTAIQFVDLPPQEDIYRFIGERLRELTGESIVVINSIDQAEGILTTRAVVGMGKYAKDIMKFVGRNPEGMEFDANDEGLAYLADGKLHDYKEGLYGLFLRTVPKPACSAIEKLFRLNKIYTIGFVKGERLFGNAAIFLPQGIELERVETIKLFIEQTSIAIQRRRAEQALKQEKEKAQKYLDVAEVMIVALNQEGEINLVNKKGASILGYQIEELVGKNWFDQCVPAADRVRAKKAFGEFLTNWEGSADHFEQTVLTRSGVERITDWQSTPLWEWVGDKKHIIGSLSSGEDITNRIRSERLLKALNKAAVVMGSVLTEQEVFNSVAKELKHLDITCMFYKLDKMKDKLILAYMSHEPAILNTVEKLIGVTYRNFSFPVDAVDVCQEVIRTKKTIYEESSKRILQQIFPKFSEIIAIKIKNPNRVEKSTFAPLIVEDQVIGIFSLQSVDLIQADIPIITAFTHQLAGAWNKTKLVQDLRKTVQGTIHTIAATVEVRDPYTAGHQKRVSELAAAIASEMHLAEQQIEGVRMASIIHDMGKIQIPAEILSKPAKLSDLEFNLIKTHPQIGYNLLKEIEFPWPIAPMILQHHEKMNGSGYPNGLKGDEIMLEARIFCV